MGLRSDQGCADDARQLESLIRQSGRRGANPLPGLASNGQDPRPQKTMSLPNEIGMLNHSEITRGVDLPQSELTDWQREADGWTIRLASTISSEPYGPGVWPEFHFWKGSGHQGKPPTVADLIHSVAIDCNYLEDEPKELDYPTGKAIEHNQSKMRRLFGHQLWERIKRYDEEEIEEAFGPFS